MRKRKENDILNPLILMVAVVGLMAVFGMTMMPAAAQAAPNSIMTSSTPSMQDDVLTMQGANTPAYTIQAMYRLDAATGPPPPTGQAVVSNEDIRGQKLSHSTTNPAKPSGTAALAGFSNTTFTDAHHKAQMNLAALFGARSDESEFTFSTKRDVAGNNGLTMEAMVFRGEAFYSTA